MTDSIFHQPFEYQDAISALHAGGVIAYPTEHCFGLGCDPRNTQAVQRLLEIKRRDKAQGVILIAADLAQIERYAELDKLAKKDQILASWPGANTWLLPAHESVSTWLRGNHATIAMRIPGHMLSRALCKAFGHPIVSTSANRHGQDAHTHIARLTADLGDDLDFIIDAPLGSAEHASVIRDAVSGETLR